MADFRIYAVKKDSKDNITHCYITDSFVSKSFDSRSQTKDKVEDVCNKKTKASVISLIEVDKKSVITYYLDFEDGKYKFKLGELVHVVDHRYLRTDRNNISADNLDNILEIE